MVTFRRTPSLWMLAAFLPASLQLAGCGNGVVNHTQIIPLSLHGSVYGGQQGVSGATVQLYAAGTGGNGTAATPLIPAGEYFPGGSPGCNPLTQSCLTTVQSDAQGGFSISGDYACPSASTQVYLVASGGNPGLTPAVNNPALVMMDALGSCGNLSSASEVTINEVTTVAAAWALAPFMTSAANVASSATNTSGLAIAMLHAQLLADPATGVSPGSALPAGNKVESGKVYALADVLAPCINSDGTAGCNPLFSAATPAGGSKPGDTLSAALQIVKNPGQNVTNVFYAITPLAPFVTTLKTAPNDWTMTMTVTGGGLNLPTSLDIDASGNIWTVGQEGPLVEFSPQGVVLSGASGYGAGYLEEAFGMSIDTNGNIWVSDYQYPSRSLGGVVAFQGSNGSSPGSVITTYTDSSLQNPDAIAADTNGNVFVANMNGYSASVYNTTSEVYGGLGSYAGLAYPEALAVDSNHGVWLSDSDNTISHFAASGLFLGHPACCYGSYGMATDGNGNVWVANYLDNTFSEVDSSNNVPLNLVSGGGINHPASVAVDAGQNVWFTNYQAASITEIAGNGNTVLAGTTTQLAAGTPISPSTGVYGTGGYGLDANLSLPIGIVPDAAGDIWIASEASSSLVMFFGLATPTATPVLPTPTAP